MTRTSKRHAFSRHSTRFGDCAWRSVIVEISTVNLNIGADCRSKIGGVREDDIPNLACLPAACANCGNCARGPLAGGGLRLPFHTYMFGDWLAIGMGRAR